MASAIRILAFCLLLAACARSGPTEVRTPMQAIEAAQAALRAGGLNEQVVAANRTGTVWTVITRSKKSAKAGHVVTVEAATGKASYEPYHSVQLGPDRPAR
ncbi:hypothetical protein [Phenylobacterium sp.]|jgi:hypothetical protein|uniref:hypothetical protein n=1 Tax=Phenylobacterium sp. TaxID=1871053 RepID=UPI002F95519A